VLIVENDPGAVEAALSAGKFACPCCGGRLAPWAHARWRVLRFGDGERRVRPRRARCVECAKTQVLLADVGLSRRRDAVEVIGAALVASASGEGYRPISTRLGVPASTVRGWLRRFRSWAGVIAVFFTRWVHALDPMIDPPAPAGSALRDAVEAVGVATRAAALRFGACAPWSMASVLTRGALLANTDCPWLAPG